MGRNHDTTQFFVVPKDEPRDPPRSRVGLGDLAQGQAMLVTVRGPGAGRTFVLDTPEMVIGRQQDCDIVLDDITVSRHHAHLRRTDSGHLLTDAGSRNGLYVNRERVGEVRLASGDEVQMGTFRLLYFSAR